MAQDCLEYTTVPGDRWDFVADMFYGDPYGYERIIMANLGVPRGEVIPSGTRLLIPFIYITQSKLSEALPPWKR